MAVTSKQNISKYNKLTHLAIKKQQLIIKKLSKWKIFPFTINNGTIALTETGYKPINSKITDFGQYELILEGNTPVIVYWKGSTKIYQKNKGIKNEETGEITGQDQFYTKKYQVGNYWNAYLIDDNSGVSFGELSGNTIFKTVSTTRQYTLIMFEEKIKVDDYLQFFCVFNDDNENIGGDTGDNQDRQWLYISNVTNYYDPYPGGKFAMQSITFSSINDKLQSSGQTIQGFIQTGGAGSGYAFPTIINGIVSVNEILMRNTGVRYSHRQFYGLEALSSISYFGRPIVQGELPTKLIDEETGETIYEQKVFASRRLFIGGDNDFSLTNIKNNGGLFAGLNDPITTNSHPETTFYNLMDLKPTGFANYENWQEFLKAKQFNLLAEKSFKGMVKFTRDKAIKSNGSSVSEARFFWDSEWEINNLVGSYNVEMNSNFRYKDPDTNVVSGTSTIDYSKITKKWMSSILNFNSCVFSSLIQMPYTYEQWLPFAISQIPLIGKMLNALILGIPVGWIITQNSQQYKKISQINCFMSAFFADSLNKIIGESGDLIPLNVFSNKNEFELGEMLGSKVSTSAMLMKLTDRLLLNPRDEKTGSIIDRKEQISSIDLSQKRDGKIYLLDENVEFMDLKTSLTKLDTETQWNPTPDGLSEQRNYAFIIDYIVTQSLGQGEERHTFFSDNPYTYQGDYNEISVAQYRIKNQAMFTNNLFNWTTQYKINMDEYDEFEETTFSYPKKIIGADPMNIATHIEIFPKNLTKVINTYEQNLGILNTTEKPIDNTEEWLINNNVAKDTWYEDFNLHDYLDESLNISNLDDLKRFYSKVRISYTYKWITKEEIKNSDGVKFTTTESFNPSKEQPLRELDIDLDKIIIDRPYKESLKKSNFEIKKWASDIYIYGAYAYRETQCPYVLGSYKFHLLAMPSRPENRIENEFTTNSMGLNIWELDNQPLVWRFQVNSCVGKNESKFYEPFVAKDYYYGTREIEQRMLGIKKILFVPR